MNERELRQKVADTALSYIGTENGSAKHKEFIDAYNARKPLPRGYAVKITDNYCQTFASAVAIKCGLADIFPIECGCGEAQKIAASMGIWVEDDSFVPQVGDLIQFDWQDSGTGNNTGWPDHVAIIYSVANGTIYYVNANDSKHGVSYGSIGVNAKNIRGFICPNYKSKADPDTKRYVVTKDCSIYTAVAARLKKDAEVDVLEVSGDLAKVKNGYIEISNLKEKPADEYYIVSTGLNLRSDAGVLHKVVKVLEKGSKVKATGNKKTVLASVWFEVVSNGVSGWCNSKYLIKA